MISIKSTRTFHDAQNVLVIIFGILLCSSVVRAKTANEFFPKLTNYYNGLRNEISDFIYNYNGTLSDPCKNQLLSFFHNATYFETFRFLDSWGRVPSGLFSSHFTDIGNYDQCIDTSVELSNPKSTIHGNYCLLKFPFDDIKFPALFSADFANYLHYSAIGEQVANNASIMRIGICIPKVCHPTEMNGLFKSAFHHYLGMDPNNTFALLSQDSCTTSFDGELETLDYVAITIIVVVVVLLLFCTIYDYVCRKKCVTPKPLFMTFSLAKNAKVLFDLSSTNNAGTIECLNGVRVLSLIWIICGHSLQNYIKNPVINFATNIEKMTNLSSALVYPTTLAVDTFLLLSGLLLAWLIFKQMEKTKGKVNIVHMYFHRLLRLIPLLALTVLFSMSLIKYIGNGPFWIDTMHEIYDLCHQNWWSTLLFIQNYYRSDEMCLIHSWYLALDTQLYVLSPLILVPLWKWRNKFLPVIILMVMIAMGNVFHQTVANNFIGFFSESTDRITKVYYPTHIRCAPFLIGIILAYILYMTKGRSKGYSKSFLAAGWIIAFLSTFGIIFGPYIRMQSNLPLTNFESAVYEALSRPVWSLVVAWVIFACHNGNGGPINTLLSHSIWKPFSRLNYSIYLSHYMLMHMFQMNIKTDMHVSNYEAILTFWGLFGVTLTASIFLFLAFEFPIIEIEKILLNSSSRARGRSNGPTEAKYITEKDQKEPSKSETYL